MTTSRFPELPFQITLLGIIGMAAAMLKVLSTCIPAEVTEETDNVAYVSTSVPDDEFVREDADP